jgi:hypothetical protein
MNDAILEYGALEIGQYSIQPGAEQPTDETSQDASLGQILEAIVPLRYNSDALDDVLGILESSQELRDMLRDLAPAGLPRAVSTNAQ